MSKIVGYELRVNSSQVYTVSVMLHVIRRDSCGVERVDSLFSAIKGVDAPWWLDRLFGATLEKRVARAKRNLVRDFTRQHADPSIARRFPPERVLLDESV